MRGASGIMRRGNRFELVLTAVILGAAAVALKAVVPLAFHTAIGTDSCPAVVGVRACYIVAACYGLIFMSQLSPRRIAGALFFFGWVPVFLLAAAGSSLELFVGNVCPASPSGWPMCYSSLFFSLAILTVFLARRSLRKNTDQATQPTEKV